MQPDSHHKVINAAFSKALESEDSIDWQACVDALPAEPSKTSMLHLHPVVTATVIILLTCVACSIPTAQDETIGYTLSGLFERDEAVELSSVHARMADLLGEHGTIESLEGSARTIQTGKSLFASFVVSLPDATENEALTILERLKAELGFSSIYVRGVSVRVKRPWSVGFFPESFRKSGWVSSITTEITNGDEEFQRTVAAHAKELLEFGIRLSIQETEDGVVAIEFAGDGLLKSWYEGRDVFNSLGQNYSEETGMPLVLGSELFGTIMGEYADGERFMAALSEQKDFLFGEKAGIAYFDSSTRVHNGRKHLNFKIVLPGTPMSEAWDIESKLSELPGALHVSANSIVFE